MLKTTLKIAALSAVSLTFLSACGASNLLNELNNALNSANLNTDDNRATLGANTPVLPVPEEQPEAVADRIASLNVTGRYELDATAPKLPFGIPSYRAPVTYSQVNDAFSLVKEGDGFTLTVNGVKHSISDLSNAHGRQSWYKGQDGVSILVPIPINGLRDSTSYLPDILAGTHAEVQGTFMSYTTDANDYTSGESTYDINYTTGYATIGVRTRPGVVANQTATATYTGLMMLDINTSGANVGFKTTYNGTVSMDVDFETNMIEGVANYIKENQDPANINNSLDAGNMNFAPTPIVGNGFEGTFTFDDRMLGNLGLTNNPTGSYAGNFFGPGADDLAGIVQFNGITAEDDAVGRPGGAVIGIGGFRGDRQ